MTIIAAMHHDGLVQPWILTPPSGQVGKLRFENAHLQLHRGLLVMAIEPQFPPGHTLGIEPDFAHLRPICWAVGIKRMNPCARPEVGVRTRKGERSNRVAGGG